MQENMTLKWISPQSEYSGIFFPVFWECDPYPWNWEFQWKTEKNTGLKFNDDLMNTRSNCLG